MILVVLAASACSGSNSADAITSEAPTAEPTVEPETTAEPEATAQPEPEASEVVAATDAPETAPTAEVSLQRPPALTLEELTAIGGARATVETLSETWDIDLYGLVDLGADCYGVYGVYSPTKIKDEDRQAIPPFFSPTLYLR